jgi:hypothetical protein
MRRDCGPSDNRDVDERGAVSNLGGDRVRARLDFNVAPTRSFAVDSKRSPRWSLNNDMAK